jgi:DNA-binding CsgD family transcriptional regulator
MNLLEKMNQPVKNQLPAGLLDNRIEIFADGTDIYAINSMGVHYFSEWTDDIIDFVRKDLERNPEAIQSLIELGIEEDSAMLRQYSRCRFGGFDCYADLETNGDSANTEYWDCGLRGNCPYEGRLCSTIKVANGILSKREIDLIRLIYDGLASKEIADELNISTTTVPVHMKNIFRKTGLRTVAEVARFAAERKIYATNK